FVFYSELMLPEIGGTVIVRTYKTRIVIDKLVKAVKVVILQKCMLYAGFSRDPAVGVGQRPPATFAPNTPAFGITYSDGRAAIVLRRVKQQSAGGIINRVPAFQLHIRPTAPMRRQFSQCGVLALDSTSIKVM